MHFKKITKDKKTRKVMGYKEKDSKYLCFKKINLSKDKVTQNIGNEEGMLIILTGYGNVEINNQEFILNRENVFEDKPEAVYIPINSKIKITTDSHFEAVLITTPCEKKQKSYFISKDDIKVNISGKKEWKRKVRSIANPNGRTFKLIIGEGLNLPGRWSGMPPHKHDSEKDNESILEEIYYFKINPDTPGYGLMTVYDKKELDEIYKLQSDDLVFIPKGYHSIVSTPGTELYFLWILAGPIKDYKVRIDEEFKNLS